VKVLLLIGSPRGGRSTSASLGLYLLEGLRQKGWEAEDLHVQRSLHSLGGARSLVASVDEVDLVVLSFPLYFDSAPAPLIRAMEIIAQHRHGTGGRTALAAIANCGFIEAKQAQSALETCRLFARDAGFEWKGGLAMGGGPMIDGKPLKDVGSMARNAREALDASVAALAGGQAVPSEAVEAMARPGLPKLLYSLLGNQMWKKEARMNGVGGRLRDRPYRRR
jgi:multimeric flavodoxin WrbA